MNLRTCGAIAVFAAMAACVSTASAQAPVGKGSVGGTFGVPFVTGDADTKEGQSPRLNLQGRFQYAFSPRTRLMASFGYGWVGYKDGTVGPYKVWSQSTDSTFLKDQLLTKFIPVEVTLIRALKDQGKGWVPYVGVGANLTQVQIVNDLDRIKDPATYDTYINWAPGVQARLGTEYFLGSNKNVAFDWNAHWSYLFSKNEESFPSGYTGPHSYLTFNFGVNVYFWPVGYKPIEVQQAPVEAPADAPSEPGLPPPPGDPAPPDTTMAPPPPPETPSVPDTTTAPPAPPTPQGKTSAPVTPVVLGEPSSAPACPAPPTPGATGSGGGMFGIPGPPPAQGDAARSPMPDASPEERGTP